MAKSDNQSRPNGSFIAVSLLKSLILAYMLTGILLLILALIMYKLNLGEATVRLGITFVYILAAAVGGLVMGKAVKQRRFLWGMAVGALYVAVILVAALLIAGNENTIGENGLSTFFLCLGGGTLGGMIS